MQSRSHGGSTARDPSRTIIDFATPKSATTAELTMSTLNRTRIEANDTTISLDSPTNSVALNFTLADKKRHH